MARSGRRTAVVERRWIGGSCPNIACLPSKNEIWLCAQQRLFRPNACKERRGNQRGEDQAGSRTKGHSPPEHQHDRTEVARVSDDAIDAVSDQFMPRLNGHQPAETTAKDKDWPDAQSATCHIEEDPKPASGIAIKGPQPLSLGVGW